MFKKEPVVTYIVVGAGQRGNKYATYALENPKIAKIVGVAEPREYFRRKFVDRCKRAKQTIPEKNIFCDWKEVAKRGKIADAVVIATPDKLHAEPAITFANQGYHIMVEKPMAVEEEECKKIAKAAQENGIIFSVGHVMRYTPYTTKIKELVSSGAIGQLLNIQHLEPVGYWHFAHSYVRGNWSSEKNSVFSLMAKSCHDIDWIRYIVGKPCHKISSFGSLSHFKKENKPKEAGNATRCLDCSMQYECPYSANRIYLIPARSGLKGWPCSVICDSVPDVESVTDALKNGPYGRCVYEHDNDVCDNQIVNMEFEGNVTAQFTMIATSKDICQRKTRIFGSKGELDCDGISIRHFDFVTESGKTYTPTASLNTEMRGHGYGDWHLFHAFIQAIREKNPSIILTDPQETLESHLLVFAAEKARLEGRVVDTKEYVTKS